jgi:hypothetical protein
MKKRNGRKAPAARTSKGTTESRAKAKTKTRAPRPARPAVSRARDAAPAALAAAPSRPASAGARLPRDPKGRRAQFYSDPAIDQLWAVVTSLTAEVSVAFDRLDTLERLLERDGRVTRASIEAYRPDDAAAAERSRRREELIQRVFQVLSQYGRG